MTVPGLFESPGGAIVEGSAVISDGEELYRYRLDRWWAADSVGMGTTWFPLMMLNPSTADATANDPTITRCINFARREGCHGLSVVNIGAGRATDPRDWAAMDDPFGPRNGEFVMGLAEAAGYIVAAWGAHPLAKREGAAWVERFRANGIPVLCFGTTKDGSPRHPLYLPAAAPLVAFTGGTR